MIDIVEYMQLSKEERMRHICLSDPCIERGGNSTRFQGILVEKLGTTFPEKKKRGVNGIFVHLCHACHNGKCSSVSHMYWGSPTENIQDSLDNGKPNVWEATVKKYGFDAAMEMARNHQRTVCKIGGKVSAEKKKRR